MALTDEGVILLRNELTTDPLGRGYVGMTDQQVFDSLIAANRTRNRTSMSGDEIRQQTSAADWAALNNGSGNSADERGQWLAFTANDQIDPFAAANVSFVQTFFGATSQTVQNLAAARVESISRLEELGINIPTLHEIAVARS